MNLTAANYFSPEAARSYWSVSQLRVSTSAKRAVWPKSVASIRERRPTRS